MPQVWPCLTMFDHQYRKRFASDQPPLLFTWTPWNRSLWRPWTPRCCVRGCRIPFGPGSQRISPWIQGRFVESKPTGEVRGRFSWFLFLPVWRAKKKSYPEKGAYWRHLFPWWLRLATQSPRNPPEDGRLWYSCGSSDFLGASFRYLWWYMGCSLINEDTPLSLDGLSWKILWK